MTATLTTLVNFNNRPLPYGSLIADANGNLFGTTAHGGASNEGTVFELVKSGSTYTLTTLVSFVGSNGAFPFGSLIADANGDLFGTTYGDGANNDGTVFELIKSGSTYSFTTLASFNGSNGFGPSAGLIADAHGDLFGTTRGNGSTNDGSVFELIKSGSTYTLTTLVSFNGSNGIAPMSGLIADAKGDLFGTTYVGGANDYGTVFELVKSGSTYTLTTLVSFNGSNGPAAPISGLIADANGDLFGTTYMGGGHGAGTVFELVKSGSTYTLTTLVSFNGSNGGNPTGDLIADAKGDLFGTTSGGGPNGDGTVFELIKSGSTYTLTTLVTFDGSNGVTPVGGLIADANGDLFGTTQGDGANSQGTVFEITNSGFVIAPTVVADRTGVSVGATVKADAAHSVLANDTDPITGDTLHVSAVNGQAANVGLALAGNYGTLTLNKDGSYSYSANHGGLLLPAGVGIDTFSYTATDGAGGSATTTLSIVVTNPWQHYVGGTPGITINGGFGLYVLDGGAGNETVNAGVGIQTLIGGPNDTLNAALGLDTFIFGPNFGKNTINHFNPILDSIELPKWDFATLGVVKAATHQVGANTVISDQTGDSVTLVGVSLSQLHLDTSHFLLA